MIMATQQENLNTLELRESDFITTSGPLSAKMHQKKIREQWLKLALKYHPDKNHSPESLEIYYKIETAYKELTKKHQDNEVYNEEINNYFTKVDMVFPDTAFDLLIEEEIEASYSALRREFYQLATEEEKQQFASEWADFFNLAQSLEQQQSRLNAQRTDYLFAQQNAPLYSRLTLELRKLMITLFAEEYLDDFQYRHALATGELDPILATRKLLSPLKWLAAFISSAVIIISTTSSYFFLNYIAMPLMSEWLKIYNEISQEQWDIGAILFFSLKLLLLPVIITTPFIFLPNLTYLAFSLPFLSTMANLLANPVNTIIRPLANYLELSPIMLSAAGALIFAASTFALFSTFSLATLSSALLPLSILLNLYGLIGLFQIIIKTYNINHALGIFQGALTVLLMIPSFFIDYPELTSTTSLLLVFLCSLASASSIYYMNLFIDNIQNEVAAEMEVLPLPVETVPEAVKEATLQGAKKAQRSHLFFNTPKDAQFIPNGENERDFIQKTASFFGGGSRNQTIPRERPDQTASVPLVLEFS